MTDPSLCKAHMSFVGFIMQQLIFDLFQDVLIISQFVQEDGNIIPKSVTGLCYEQQSKMKKLIYQAHRAGTNKSIVEKFLFSHKQA